MKSAPNQVGRTLIQKYVVMGNSLSGGVDAPRIDVFQEGRFFHGEAHYGIYELGVGEWHEFTTDEMESQESVMAACKKRIEEKVGKIDDLIEVNTADAL